MSQITTEGLDNWSTVDVNDTTNYIYPGYKRSPHPIRRVLLTISKWIDAVKVSGTSDNSIQAAMVKLVGFATDPPSAWAAITDTTHVESAVKQLDFRAKRAGVQYQLVKSADSSITLSTGVDVFDYTLAADTDRAEKYGATCYLHVTGQICVSGTSGASFNVAIRDSATADSITAGNITLHTFPLNGAGTNTIPFSCLVPIADEAEHKIRVTTSCASNYSVKGAAAGTGSPRSNVNMVLIPAAY